MTEAIFQELLNSRALAEFDVHGLKGEVVKIIKTAIDITAKKVQEESLTQKSKMLPYRASLAHADQFAKYIFLTNISHGIRTPLNSIVGNTDALAETALSDEQIMLVQALQRSNRQLELIINDLLDLARMNDQVRKTSPMLPKTIETHSSARLEQLNILVVDDVDDNRNLFQIYLKNTRHTLHFATDGIEAIEKFKSNQFDMIFMDIQMPRLNGYDAAKKIREIEKTKNQKNIPLIACTANAFPEDIEKSCVAGFDLHLSKPIRKETIIKTLNQFFRSPPNEN